MESGDAGIGLVLYVAGAVCALWAQNTGRNPWLWFFAGLFLNVFALAAMLVKNAGDLVVEGRQESRAPSPQ